MFKGSVPDAVLQCSHEHLLFNDGLINELYDVGLRPKFRKYFPESELMKKQTAS